MTVMTGTSFKRTTSSQPRRRIIASIDGLPRGGKTHFSLTAPGPLAYMQLDPGGDDVVPKFAGNKEVHVASYMADVKPGSTVQVVADAAEKVWNRFSGDYEAAIKVMRTLVVDTGTEAYELDRLFRHGKLSQVLPENYGIVFADMRRLLRMAYNHDCNVIWLHKLGDEYAPVPGSTDSKAKRNKTGRLVRKGFSGMGFEVQIEAIARWNEEPEEGEEDFTPGFQIEVVNCRQRHELRGLKLDGPMCNFPSLAMQVYPGTKITDWK
jgi:hypothetical protein